METPHQWVREDLPTCGETYLQPKSPLKLSFPTCSRTTKLPREIEQLIIHESIHHLGIKDEQLTDNLATVIHRSMVNPNCPGHPLAHKEQHIYSSPFDVCIQKNGQLECLHPTGRVAKFLKLVDREQITDFSGHGDQICTIKNGKPHCWDFKNGDFTLIDKKFLPRHTPKVFSIQVSGSGHNQSGCLFDQAGLACWGNHFHGPPLRGQTRLSKFSNIIDFDSSHLRVCLIEKRQGYCSEMLATIHGEPKFFKIEGLVNPRAVKVFRSHALFLDDHGLALVQKDKLVQRHSQFSYPSKAVLTEYGRACVVDQGSLLCKDKVDEPGEWNTILTGGKVIELQRWGNESLCYISENFWDCL